MTQPKRMANGYVLTGAVMIVASAAVMIVVSVPLAVHWFEVIAGYWGW